MEIEKECTRLHSLENSLWKRLWACRKNKELIIFLYSSLKMVLGPKHVGAF